MEDDEHYYESISRLDVECGSVPQLWKNPVYAATAKLQTPPRRRIACSRYVLLWFPLYMLILILIFVAVVDLYVRYRGII